MTPPRNAKTESEWLEVEVYATFMKLAAEIEQLPEERLSDSVNRARNFIHLRNARTEPLSSNYPVISRLEKATTVAKSAVILISPSDDKRKGQTAMWREKVMQAAAINTGAFSIVCDVYLEKRRTLEEHLERSIGGDFLPVTNVSALWIAAGQETHAVQRPFALLNPTAILSFSPR